MTVHWSPLETVLADMIPTVKVNDAVLIPNRLFTESNHLCRVIAVTKDGRACVNKHRDEILIEPEVGVWERVGYYIERKPHWFWRIINIENSHWDFVPD